MPKNKRDEVEQNDAAVEPAAEAGTDAAVEAAPEAAPESEIEAVEAAAQSEEATPANSDAVSEQVNDPVKRVRKRAERVGVVASDKMTATVTVRVDRLVKHPIYRKYVRRRKKFMAHDELGSKTGDKVRIVETRPMSARKRWRVVEIIQKAEL